MTTVLTPRARTVLKRWVFWVVAAVLLLGLGVGVLLAAGNATAGRYLDPTNPAPQGAMAVAEVLRQQGVTVIVTSSFEETQQAAASPGPSTLLIYDIDGYLSADKLTKAIGLSSNPIVVDPAFRELQAIAPGVAQAGYVDEKLDADCSVAYVSRAETVSGAGTGFRVIDDADSATSCLGSGDGVYSLIQVRQGADTVTILGATGSLTNELVINDGNAAFALGLLGQNETLVWYQPSFEDAASTEPATLGDLTPLWVTPALEMLAIAFIVAAVWRGRRFGPLVIENLPVTVRASETMLGRARLYERSSSRLRALDALRIGTVQRLAVLCGLPTVATVDDVVAAVVAATGAQVGDIRQLLVDRVPETDRDLIALSDALTTLERDVTRATRP